MERPSKEPRQGNWLASPQWRVGLRRRPWDPYSGSVSSRRISKRIRRARPSRRSNLLAHPRVPAGLAKKPKGKEEITVKERCRVTACVSLRTLWRALSKGAESLEIHSRAIKCNARGRRQEQSILDARWKTGTMMLRRAHRERNERSFRFCLS